MALTPFAKRLGMKYYPKDLKKFLKRIFITWGDKQEKLNVGTLEDIRASIEKIVSPTVTAMQMLGEVAKPLVAVIPPQYLAIGAACILIPTVILPARIAGLTLWYYAEEYLRLPFAGKPQHEIDKIPATLLADQFIISRVIQRKITCTIRQFYTQLSRIEQLAFIYEAPKRVKEVLLLVEKILEYYPNLFEKGLELNLDFINLPLPDLDEELTVMANFYYGWRKILPPLLHRVIFTVKQLFYFVESLVPEDLDEDYVMNHFWRTAAFGLFGFIPTKEERAARKKEKEEDED